MNNTGTILRFIFIVGCVIALIANYSYKASEINRQQSQRQYENLQREEAIRKAQREREHEEQHKKELEENAENAKFQVERWREKTDELVLEMKKLHVVETSNAVRSETQKLKNEFLEAKEQLLYWIGKRAKELKAEQDKAEAEGNTEEFDDCKEQLQKLSRIYEDFMSDSEIFDKPNEED